MILKPLKFIRLIQRNMFNHFLSISQTYAVNMKLGLLVVLAVAVLVPSLSESRIVSKCELKQKLDQAIQLPRSFQRLKERILATGEINEVTEFQEETSS